MNILGIIPSRGSGDDWPWVNARKLGGHPLVGHSILSAKKSKYIGRLVVSTEDPGIAKIAIAYGAEAPFLRSPQYAEPGSTLNEALLEILDFLKRQDNYEPEVLVVLEADAPLRTAELIDAAIDRFLQGNVDSVVAVTPEYDQFWKKEDQGIIEISDKRTRKAGLEPLLRDTGVVRVVNPKTLTKDQYLGQKVGHVLADARNSFTILTAADFRMAERLLQPRRVLFRVDGGRNIGLGHLYSAVRIAEYLVRQDQQTEIQFLVGSQHVEGAAFIAERGLQVEVFPSDDLSVCLNRIDRFGPDLIINDLMTVPKDYMDQLRLSGYRIINIVDSLADVEEGSYPNVLINFSHEEHEPRGYDYFCGSSYATLDAAHTSDQAARNRILHAPPSVLITMGGSDPENLTAKCLKVLDAMPGTLVITVVMGPAFSHEAELIGMVRGCVKPVTLQKAVPNMSAVYAETDIALAAGGRTLYELSAMGIPAVTLSQNQREQERVEQFSRLGSIISLGLGKDVTESQILMAIHRLLSDAELRRRMQEAGARLVDGNGVHRIVEIIRNALARQEAI